MIDHLHRRAAARAGRFVGLAVALIIGTLSPALAAPSTQTTTNRPWMDTSLSPEQRANLLLAQMTLDEKVAEVHGDGSGLGPAGFTSGYAGHVPGNARLGIPDLYLADGPIGVGDAAKGVTAFPAAVNTAATWNPSLASQYGQAYAAEQAGKGNNVALAPTINILRIPLWGRAFETFTEDPYLNGQMAAAEVQGIQSQHVIATAKHFVANNQEILRNSINANVSERALNEIYYPGFKASVQQGGTGSIMCAYNRINGPFACENADTLTKALKDAWAFDGFVMSDWFATHSTGPAANAGLDMEMPSGAAFAAIFGEYFGSALKQAVLSGQVPMSRLDDMVRRILTAMFRVGLFEHPIPDHASSASADVSTPAHQQFARDLSEQGTVLLKNSGNVLPLTNAVKSLAVIGDDAGAGAQIQGGGSAAVIPSNVVTPIQGITARAGSSVKVTYAQGTLGIGALPLVPSSALTPSSGTGPGLMGAYYASSDFTGAPITTQVTSTLDFSGSPVKGLPSTWSAQWTGTVTPPSTGTYRFSLSGGGGIAHLYINGQLVVTLTPTADSVASGLIDLTSGTAASIKVDFLPVSSFFSSPALHLGWQPQEDVMVQAATTAARNADVAVVFASDLISEGRDRNTLALPGDQDKLIAAVAAANPHTVVVLNTGAAVLMPWLNQVAGVLEAWYPGQEDGDAIAAVLFGNINPSGKLPETFPASNQQIPTKTTLEYPGNGTDVNYDEGILVGYRWYDATGQQPLFPFGYGLSYTTFSFSHLQTTPTTIDGSSGAAVQFDVTNTGSRAGADVAQVYLGLPAATDEPPKRLVGFQRVQLNPGETQHVTVPIDPQALAYWDTSNHAWATADGDYAVYLGNSSRDISLTDTLHVHHAAAGPGSSPSFTVPFTSSAPGQGNVYFGPGPNCSGLVEVATQDVGAGSTNHLIVVRGNELPGTVGDAGLQPGTTYWYEKVTVTSSGTEIDNNEGQCYSVTIPKT